MGIQVDLLYHFLSFTCGIVAMIVFAYLKPTDVTDFKFTRDKWERLLASCRGFAETLRHLEEMSIEIRTAMDMLERRRPPRKTSAFRRNI